MMSHYGLPFEYDDRWICGALELSIETLAGTAFEIKVSPNDTIMAIKSKIQSVEGIPVSQQHLLYNLKELDNSAFIRDYSIQNGATLKLVLSMRGGPISTKRLPPVDEMAWRDFQDLISVTRKDDLFDKLPTGSRVTVLVFRDGDQVNLLRVVENEDGSFSPLSESWNGSSIRNLFAEEDQDESAKRLRENSVTMGKMQELKEKLETLSIQRKEKKGDHSSLMLRAGSRALSSLSDQDFGEIPKRKTMVSFSSGDCGRPNCLKLIHRAEEEAREPQNIRPRNRLLSCTKTSMSGLTKARKEAGNIIRMQSNFNIFVDSETNQGYRVRKTPLPDIRRSSRVEDDGKKSDVDDGLEKNSRGKTARSTSIVDENDLAMPTTATATTTTTTTSSTATATATSTAEIRSSRLSLISMPSNEQMAIAYSEMPRDTSPVPVLRNKFRMSRYQILDKDERPKTTPGNLDNRETPSAWSRRSWDSWPASGVPESVPGIRVSTPDGPDRPCPAPDHDQSPKRGCTLSINPSVASTASVGPPSPLRAPSQTPARPAPKKRLRCSHCKKKLNITNAYTCRCGHTFCSVHRYSEVHDCLFDYKEEGKRILQKANPLVAASKLPKI